MAGLLAWGGLGRVGLGVGGSGPPPRLRLTCIGAPGVVHGRLGVAGGCGSTAPVPAVPAQAGRGQVAPATQARLKVTGSCEGPGQ